MEKKYKRMKYCKRCGEIFTAYGKHASYCDNCIIKSNNKQNSISHFKRWLEKHDLEEKKPGFFVQKRY